MSEIGSTFYDTMIYFLAECNGIDRSITMNWAEFLILGWILVLVQTPYVVPTRRDNVGKLVWSCMAVISTVRRVLLLNSTPFPYLLNH